MHFGNSQFLWLLAAWPVLGWLGWRALVWRDRMAGRLGDPELVGRLYPASIRLWRRRRLWLLMGSLFFLIVAAARPQYGRVEQTLRSVGTNVLVALDCSPSMRAADVQPSRFEAAKKNLKLMIRRLEGNRVGIISFAGVAFLQCPMTLDYELAMVVLDALDTGTISVPGTDIGEAIREGVRAFEAGADQGSRALVLITDGEDNEGKAEEAAGEAAQKGIRIYTLGIGTARGAPIPEESGGFKKTKEDTTVNSQLRMETLRKIAEITHGQAYEAAESPVQAIQLIAQSIMSQQKSELEARRQIIYQDRFQWFLGPALLMLAWLMLSRPEPTRLTETVVTPREAVTNEA